MRKQTVTSAVVVLALLALAGCGGSSNPRPRTIDSYVAMGDSYTALSGVGPYSDAGCNRTTSSYPELVAKALRIEDLANVSCGGATSDALTNPQRLMRNRGSRPPQLSAASRSTKLVTLGMGMNNNGLAAKVLYLCVPVNGVTSAQCDQVLALPEQTVAQQIENSINPVGQNLEDIRDAAPNARVVLVGYPRVLPDDRDCPTAFPVPAAAARLLRTTMRLVNQRLAEIAKAAKVNFVDVYAASKGHELCSTDPWMAGVLNVPGKALQFHPYASYHRAVADEIVALLTK